MYVATPIRNTHRRPVAWGVGRPGGYSGDQQTPAASALGGHVRGAIVASAHTLMTRSIDTFMFAASVVAVLTGCASEIDDEDGADDSFLDSGKADGLGGDLEAFEVLGILRLVNQGELAYLDSSRTDGGVGLAASAVAEIAELRDRAALGPVDPDGMVIDSLEALDAIPYVGPRTFERLLVAAREDRWIIDAPAPCRQLAPPTSEIANFLKLFTTDGSLSMDDWSFMESAARLLPKRASADARALVAVLGDPNIEIAADLRATIRDLVERQFGYAAPSSTTSVAESLASNITEVDRHLACVSALAARDTTRELVAVIDSGFQIDHPALSGRIWTNPTEVPDNATDDDGNGLVDDVHGWDFVRSVADVTGPNLSSADHGTHVGGCAVTGSSRIQMISLRAMDGLVDSTTGPRIVAAIDYAAAHGARVVNLSQVISEDFYVPVIEAMARHPELLFIAASGNNAQRIGSPLTSNARLVDVPNVLIVAAHDDEQRLTDYATFGSPGVDLAALGDRVSARELTGTTFYELRHGSSQAAPAVANAAAKLRLVNPGLDVAAIRSVLTRTVDAAPAWDGIVEAGGSLNTTRAVSLAALLELIERGVSKHDAAYQLLLSAAERRVLLPLVDAQP